jgi:DNA/RNA-binding domain of Phe-tRNA-synthetase-like protein
MLMSNLVKTNDTYFRYSSEILARYPNIVGGVIHAIGIRNGATPDALRAEYAAEQAVVKARVGSTPLSELPSLAAWRAAFRAFGVDPTQYRSAAESLLRRLTKQGDILNINTLVDIGNLVSIRYGLPVAVFDLAQIVGGITVHFARGDEPFSDLGSSESIHPEAGEVVFTDEAGVVHARRWCWRQSAQSAARETTTDILVTIEAHHERGQLDVEAAQADVLALLRQYAGDNQTRYASSILTASPR